MKETMDFQFLTSFEIMHLSMCHNVFLWVCVSLYSPGCSGAHFVDQPGLENRALCFSPGIK